MNGGAGGNALSVNGDGGTPWAAFDQPASRAVHVVAGAETAAAPAVECQLAPPSRLQQKAGAADPSRRSRLRP